MRRLNAPFVRFFPGSGRSYTEKFGALTKTLRMNLPDEEKGEFPRDLGFICRMDHDKKTNETQLQYQKRCIQQVQEVVRSNTDYFIFFVTPTVLAARQTNPHVAENFAVRSRQEFMNGKISNDTMRNTIPGHIAVYTKRADFISHKRSSDQSQEKAIADDVKNSIRDGLFDDTYIVAIKNNLFSRPIEVVKKEIESYDLAAQDKSDNCATAILMMVIPGLSKDRIREHMNPLEAIRMVLVETVEGKLEFESSTKAVREMKVLVRNAGMDRSLPEIAADQCRRRVNLNVKSKNKNTGDENGLASGSHP